MLMRLTKQFHPDFVDQSRKPRFPVEIDWSNPLAQGLRHCLIFRHGSRDLVTGFVSPSTVPEYSQPKGMLLTNSGIEDRLQYNTGKNAPQKFSVYCSVRYNTLVQDHALVDVNNQNFIFWADTFSGGLRTAAFAGLAKYGTTGELNSTSDYIKWGGRADGVGNTASTFVNGAISVSNQGIGTTVWESSPNVAFGGNWNSLGKISNADYEFIFMWDRELSDEEFYQINKNPYQILKPANNIWLPLSTGGGITVSLGQATESNTSLSIGSIHKTVSIPTIVNETNQTNSLGATSTISMGIISEVDSSLSLNIHKGITLVLVSEGNSNQYLSISKSYSIATAIDTSSGFSLTHSKVVPIGLPTESDSVLGIAGQQLNTTVINRINTCRLGLHIGI